MTELLDCQLIKIFLIKSNEFLLECEILMNYFFQKL